MPPTTTEQSSEGHDQAEQYDIETDLLRALTRRDMSAREVRDWLAQRDVAPVDIDEWLERLSRLGYVNDERMAEHLVETLVRRGGKGRSALLRALTERGIDQHTAQTALQGLDQASELQVASELVAQRISRTSVTDVTTLTRRLEGFLARRGFSVSVIREAIRLNLGPRG